MSDELLCEDAVESRSALTMFDRIKAEEFVGVWMAIVLLVTFSIFLFNLAHFFGKFFIACIVDYYHARSSPAPVALVHPRGKFIVFEGIDRSGKTTQTLRLRDYVERKLKLPVKVFKFPHRQTTIGKAIDAHLSGVRNDYALEPHAVHLLFSANRWESNQEILDALNAGTTVIADRYAYSGMIYSTAKDLDRAWCMAADRGLPKPDAIVYLKVDIETTQGRAQFGREIYEQLEFQRKVSHRFEEEWHSVPSFERANSFASVFALVLVNANTDPDNLELKIREKLSPLLLEPIFKSVEQLWV
jgi:dTMP kinase